MQGDGCGMTTRRERTYEPVTVPFAATPAGEPPSIREWANPCVWTERMLDTLETGVRGGRWHTLIDKVYSPLNLYAASRKVIGQRGAAGVDHQTVEHFATHSREELDRLHENLRSGPTVRRPCNGSGYRNREATRNDRWGFRRCGTAWYRPPSCMSWNRSSTPRFRNTAMDFDTAEGVITPWNASSSC